MIDSAKHPLVEKIRHLKGGQQNTFIIDNPIHLDWLLAAHNPQFNIEFLLVTERDLFLNYKLPSKFLVKPSILHHVHGKKTPLLAYVTINFSMEPAQKVVVLDNIVDYGNIGSIIRNSYMMGVKDFIIINDFNVFHNKTIDASRGLIFFSNILIFNNINEPFQWLQDHGYHLMITSFKGENLKPMDKEKTAILLGNESNGYNPLWDSYGEKTWITIPMVANDQCDSMNVAASAAIVVYMSQLI